jgi:hypothetical protein
MHEPGLSVTSIKRFVTPNSLNCVTAAWTSRGNWLKSVTVSPKEPTNIWGPEEMLSGRNAEAAWTRTTPVLLLGKMYDLMTPVLPFIGVRLGANCSGRSTAGLITALGPDTTARASRDWLWVVRLLLDRRSTPLVVLVATQLLAQLGGKRKRKKSQFASEDHAVKTY